MDYGSRSQFNMEVSKMLIVSIIFIVSLSFDLISSDDVKSDGLDVGINIDSQASNLTNATLEKSNSTGSDSDDIAFGTLHTLQNFSRWAAREENMTKELAERLKLIEAETKLIKEYLTSYKDTSEKALKHVHEPKVTPEERGEVIGSSAVLGHHMITRYTSVISRLREFLTSIIYTRNQDRIEDILDLDINDGGNGLVNKTEELDSVNTTEGHESLNKTEGPESINKTDELESANKTVADPTTLNVNGTKKPEDFRKFPEIWPRWEDKYMSTITFLHIQEVTGYLPEELRRGFTYDTNFGGTLNALECSEIGMFALYRGYVFMAIQWLELAKQIVVNEGDDSITIEMVSYMLTVAIQENNRMIHSIRNRNLTGDEMQEHDFRFMIENIYIIKPIREGMPESKRITGREYYYKNKSDKNATFYEINRFCNLCMGGTYQTPEEQATLKCYYEQHRHPYLYINPVKAEQLSESPPVYQFYEMVGDKEIERIKGLGVPYMSLSQLVGEHDTEKITQFRTSVGTGLSHDEIPKVNRFAEIVTGLTLKNTSELTQMVEYTYGRYYTYHTDALEDEEETMDEVLEIGDRLATILYYLELPNSGGLTPFIAPGISAHPVRGSAVLWLNLFRNGTARQDVEHGACPIIHGHKIIMNHWVRHLGNLHTYKCSLNQFE